MSKDNLGDRMKAYEAIETTRRLSAATPIYARVDGRGFSRFTRGMEKPYDFGFGEAMLATAEDLVDHTGAIIAYVQSDEISLVWQASRPEASVFFDGKVQKLVSVLAGMATAAFTRALSLNPAMIQFTPLMPHFDARVFSLPSQSEAANAFLWRAMDAQRNAVQMAASARFSHKRMFKRSLPELREMLTADGIDFDAYPENFRFGTFVRRVTVERTLTEDEIARLPEHARPAPDVLVTRSEVRREVVPDFLGVENRQAFIFENEPVRRR